MSQGVIPAFSECGGRGECVSADAEMRGAAVQVCGEAGWDLETASA